MQMNFIRWHFTLSLSWVPIYKIQGLRKIHQEKVQNIFPEQNISVQIC